MPCGSTGSTIHRCPSWYVCCSPTVRDRQFSSAPWFPLPWKLWLIWNEPFWAAIWSFPGCRCLFEALGEGQRVTAELPAGHGAWCSRHICSRRCCVFCLWNTSLKSYSCLVQGSCRCTEPAASCTNLMAKYMLSWKSLVKVIHYYFQTSQSHWVISVGQVILSSDWERWTNSSSGFSAGFWPPDHSLSWSLQLLPAS